MLSEIRKFRYNHGNWITVFHLPSAPKDVSKGFARMLMKRHTNKHIAGWGGVKLLISCVELGVYNWMFTYVPQARVV